MFSVDEDDHLEGADFGDNEPDNNDDYGVALIEPSILQKGSKWKTSVHCI